MRHGFSWFDGSKWRGVRGWRSVARGWSRVMVLSLFSSVNKTLLMYLGHRKRSLMPHPRCATVSAPSSSFDDKSRGGRGEPWGKWRTRWILWNSSAISVVSLEIRVASLAWVSRESFFQLTRSVLLEIFYSGNLDFQAIDGCWFIKKHDSYFKC